MPIHCTFFSLDQIAALTNIESLQRRFDSYVSIAAPDACWPFTGARHRHGYGHIFIAKIRTNNNTRSIQITASRLAYLFKNKYIPTDNPFILHRCDNPSCCNPSHLYAGTQKDNMHDSWERNRRVKGIIDKGEKNNTARLHDGDIPKIRALCAEGTKWTTIASLFGVSVGAIQAIAQGRTWTHIP